MKNLKKDILSQIKREKIRPISKNIFRIKKIFLFIFLGLSIFIGATSFAIILGYLLEADWFLGHKLGLLKVVQSFLPIFWLTFLFIGIVIGYGEFKKTDRGYKFYLRQIIIGNIFISLVLGIILYFSGISQIIENKIQAILPSYREYFVGDRISRMKAVWQNEEKGLLIGQIFSTEGFSPLKEVWFKDSNKKLWKIIISKNTKIRHNLQLKKGLKIKIMGEKISKKEFRADEIRPFLGNGKGFKENHGGSGE